MKGSWYIVARSGPEGSLVENRVLAVHPSRHPVFFFLGKKEQTMTKEELQILANAAELGAYRGALVANKPALTIDEAKDFLGISNRHLRLLIHDGKVRYSRLDGGKRMLIDREDLLRLRKHGPAPR